MPPVGFSAVGGVTTKVRFFAQNRSRKYRQKVTVATLSPTTSHPDFQLLAQTAHVRFCGRKWVHLAFAQRIAHKGTHGETGGVSDGGGITTLGAFHTFRKPCVAGYQNGKLCRFWALVGGALEEHRKPSEQRCAYACRCPEGVAAPLGCVIFIRMLIALLGGSVANFPALWYDKFNKLESVMH